MQFESERAIFKFEESDSDLIQLLADYLDSHVDNIYKFFEVNMPKEKLVVNIIPTKEEFDVLSRQAWGQSEKWMIGFYKNNEIIYLSLHDFKNTEHRAKYLAPKEALEYYKKTIVHEYVHYVNDIFKKVNNCGYTEKYLSDGIATYLSGQHENEDLPFDFTCEDLLTRGDMYSGYYLVTKYFVENYDKTFVLDIFKSNRRSREFLKNELFDKAKKFYQNAKHENNQLI